MSVLGTRGVLRRQGERSDLGAVSELEYEMATLLRTTFEKRA
jgi:hypothetical protein